MSEIGPACAPGGFGHCATCADEATQVYVLAVDADSGMAEVQLGDARAEIDVSLIDDVRPGAWLLIHGGVALGMLGEAPHGG